MIMKIIITFLVLLMVGVYANTAHGAFTTYSGTPFSSTQTRAEDVATTSTIAKSSMADESPAPKKLTRKEKREIKRLEKKIAELQKLLASLLAQK